MNHMCECRPLARARVQYILHLDRFACVPCGGQVPIADSRRAHDLANLGLIPRGSLTGWEAYRKATTK